MGMWGDVQIETVVSLIPRVSPSHRAKFEHGLLLESLVDEVERNVLVQEHASACALLKCEAEAPLREETDEHRFSFVPEDPRGSSLRIEAQEGYLNVPLAHFLDPGDHPLRWKVCSTVSFS